MDKLLTALIENIGTPTGLVFLLMIALVGSGCVIRYLWDKYDGIRSELHTVMKEAREDTNQTAETLNRILDKLSDLIGPKK